MLVAPQPSPFDFYFNVGSVPVRVSWSHWVGAALLGWGTLYTLGRASGPQPIFLLLWVAVVFVSILVHELGHAFAAKLCGYPSQVVLYFFGGLASYPQARNLTYGREIFIVLAGPGAGFLLGLISIVAWIVFSGPIKSIENELLATSLVFTLTQLMFVNIAWTVLNLIPVLPLDGGRVCDVICRVWSPNRGGVVSRWIGVVAASVVALLAFRYTQHLFVGGLFIMFAIWNYQDIQRSR